MTSYRDTRFLMEAVQSVLAQDFHDFELIVVDDGSPDPAPVAALSKLDPRIHVLRLEHNVGTAEAANRGIATARAPIIARLDSDDVAESGWLTAIMAALDADPELGLVGTAVTLIDEAGRKIAVDQKPESDFAIRFTLLFHSPFYHPTVAFRRHLFDAVGGYRADQPVSQDHYLWHALLPRARARNLPQKLVRYRSNSAGLSQSNSSGDWRSRTHPIREALWQEIGLDYPLSGLALGSEADALIKGSPSLRPALHSQAVQAIENALDNVIAMRGNFIWAGDEEAADQFAAQLRARLSAPPQTAEQMSSRFTRFIRNRGIGALPGALWRRVKASSPFAWRPYDAADNDDPVMNALHPISPYSGFDPSDYPQDLQGWGSVDPVFRILISELRPKLIIEVGTWKGASAIHMASLCREFGMETRIICVDTWLGSPEHALGQRPEWRESLQNRHGYPQLYFTFLSNVVRSGVARWIVPLPNSSDNAAVILKEKGLLADLIYIDGAHEEDAVYRDLCNYWELLTPGGALVGDDYVTWPGVQHAAARFTGEHGVKLEDFGDKFVVRRKG